MNSPRLKDIAKEASVSVATVSLVLNGKKNFSVKVRDRVYDAAQRLKYIKPMYAPAVATKQLKHLALLVPEDDNKAFTWNFIRQVIIHLETALAREQYSPVIIPIRSKQSPDDMLEKILASKVRGIFSLLCGTPELFQRLEQGGLPVVVMASSEFQNRFHTVCVDDFQGAYEATRHLLSLGHQKIAYAEYLRAASLSIMHDRFIGFKKALKEAQLSFRDDCHLCANLLHLENFQADLCAMFMRPDAPTAIFVQDDYLAAQIMLVLQKIGRRVPKDISVIAVGDLMDYTQPFAPRISTMQTNTRLLGSLACELIVRHFDREPGKVDVIKVNPQLVERGSCQVLKAA